MRVMIRWNGREPRSAAERRLTRFRRVLLAAQRAVRYRPLLKDAGLGTPEAVAAVDAIEPALERLPSIHFEEFRDSPAAFENPAGHPPGLQPFLHPLPHAPKTAVFMPGFEPSESVRVFTADWMRQLQRLPAAAVAAPVRVLRELAAAILDGRVKMLPLQHVIAFTGFEQGSLGEDDRTTFWRVFQAPVFEQRLGFDGRVIAWECEAHDGLHLLPENAMLEQALHAELLLTSFTDLLHPTLRVGTQLSGAIQFQRCDCGRSTPKLTALRRLSAPRRASAAAAAAN